MAKTAEQIIQQLGTDIEEYGKNYTEYAKSANNRSSGYNGDEAAYTAEVAERNRRFAAEGQRLKTALKLYKNYIGEDKTNEYTQYIDDIIGNTRQIASYASKQLNDVTAAIQSGKSKYETVKQNAYDSAAQATADVENGYKVANTGSAFLDAILEWGQTPNTANNAAIPAFSNRETQKDIDTYQAQNKATSDLPISDSLNINRNTATWTDDEWNTYYYLLNTNEKAAAEYAQQANAVARQRYFENINETKGKIADWAGQNLGTGILATAGSLLLTPLAATETLAYGLEKTMKGELSDESKGMITPSVVSSSLQSGVSQSLAEKYPAELQLGDVNLGNIASNLYGMGYSMLQSRLMTSMFGGAASVILGGSAASAAYHDAIENGATDDQAIINGLTAGIFETIFEYASIEHLFSLQNSKQWYVILKNLFSQGGFEASEEFFTTLANNLTELAIYGKSSSFYKSVDKYMGEGKSESEAKRLAWCDKAGELINDTVGGFVSGFFMGGTQMLKGSTVDAYQQGKAISKSGQSDALKKLASKYAADTTTGKKLAQINDLETNGKKVGNMQLGRLYQAAANDATTQNQADTVKALMDEGASEDVAKAAYALADNQRKNRKANINTLATALGEVQNSSEYVASTAVTANNVAKNRSDAFKAISDGIEQYKASKAEEEEKAKEAKRQARKNKKAGIIETAPQATETAETETNTTTEAEVETTATESVAEPEVEAENKVVAPYAATVAKGKVAKAINTTRNGTPVVYYEMSNGDGTVTSTEKNAVKGDTGYLLRVASKNSMSAVATNRMLDAVSVSDAPLNRFALGFAEVYNSARYGIALNGNGYSQDLSESIKEQARNAGIADRQADATTRIKTTKASDIKLGTARVDASVQDTPLSYKQGNTLEVAKALAKAFNLRIDIFADSTGTMFNGRMYKQNGYYSRGDGVIHLNVLAGTNGNQLAAYALAHELTHHIKNRAGNEFATLAKFVSDTYEAQGLSFDARVQDTMEEYGYNYNVAYEEVIAKSCESLLTDETMLNKLSTMAQTDSKIKQLWNSVKQWFERTFTALGRLISSYKGSTPDTPEGIIVQKWALETRDKLAELYISALQAAGENYADDSMLSTEAKDALGNDAKVEYNEDGMVERITNKDESIQLYSFSTFNLCRDRLIQSLTSKHYTPTAINNQLNVVDDMHDMYGRLAEEHPGLKQALAVDAVLSRLDNKTVVTHTLIPNGDYPVNFEWSTDCKKRRDYQRVLNRLIQDGIFDSMIYKGSAIAAVNKILASNDFETACLVCFVESRRLNFKGWATDLCTDWNTAVKEYYINHGIEGEPTPFAFTKDGSSLTEADIAELRKQKNAAKGKNAITDAMSLGQGNAYSKMQKVIEALPALAHTLSSADILIGDNFTQLRALCPELYSIARSRYGAGTPKFNQAFAAYTGDAAMADFKYVEAVTGKTIDNKPAYRKKAVAFLKETYANNEAGFEKDFGYEISKLDKYNARKLDPVVEMLAFRYYLYDIGGARSQSFSDFIIEESFDKMQYILDMAALQMPGHEYTKEISSARIFGQTGLKENMSVIHQIDPTVDKDHIGLTLMPDGTYGLVPSDYYNHRDNGGQFVQSINFKDAVALMLDPRYSANVGTIAIGFSREHIRMMLDNPFYRMVIPYHKSGMLEEYASAVNIDKATDYTGSQSTKVNRVWEVVTKEDGTVEYVEVKNEEQKTDDNNEAAKKKKKKKKVDDSELSAEEKEEKKGNPFGFDTDYLYNKRVNELIAEGNTDAARQAAKDYIEWCLDSSKHTVTKDGKKYIATFTPKFNEFSDHHNYYKLLADFNMYDTISDLNNVTQIAPQGAITNTFATKENALSGQALEDYKARLKATGLFSEKDIAKYTAVAQKTLEQIISDELTEREIIRAAQDAKFDSTYELIKAKLFDIQRTPEYAKTTADWFKHRAEVNETWAEKNPASARLLADHGIMRSMSALDSDGNKLSPQQQEYFKGSKVRDENGNLLVVYHGTDSEFYEFDYRKADKNGHAQGYGFYLTPSIDMAKHYGDRIIKGYANINRVIYDDQKTITRAELKRLVTDLVDTDLETYKSDGLTWQDSFLSNYLYTYEKGLTKQAAISQFSDMVYKANDNDSDIIYEVCNADGMNYSAEASKRFYDVLTKSIGFDGAWYGDEIVVFNSNQIKSIDNTIPTSDSDIRYSMSAIDTEYNQAVASNDTSAQERLVEQAARLNGYDSPKLYHGTDNFGFTKIKTAGLEGERWSPFFATNDIETASTYSGINYSRTISADRSEMIKSGLKEAKKVVNRLASKITKKGTRKTAFNVSPLYDAMVTFADQLISGKSMYAVNDILEDSVLEYYQSYAQSDGFDDNLYWDDVWNALVKIEDTIAPSFTNAGNYAFYANTSNMLTVDGKGRTWSSIFFDEEMPYETEAKNGILDFFRKIQNSDYALEDVANENDVFKRKDLQSALLSLLRDYENGNYDDLPIGKYSTAEELEIAFENAKHSPIHNTRDMALYAQANGYDGVILNNITDNGGKQHKDISPADIYIFFNPQSQVKSADPVTYDDNGNVIPLSERFNPGNEDIRWSISEIIDKDGNNYGKGVILDNAFYDNMTEKEKTYALHRLVDSLGGKKVTAYSSSGDEYVIQIVDSKKFVDKNGKARNGNRDLKTNFDDKEWKQGAIYRIKEISKISQQGNWQASKHTHGWIDNYAKNGFDTFNVLVQSKDKSIRSLTLLCGKSTTGEHILYDITAKKIADGISDASAARSGGTPPLKLADNIISGNTTDVNTQNDSDINMHSYSPIDSQIDLENELAKALSSGKYSNKSKVAKDYIAATEQRKGLLNLQAKYLAEKKSYNTAELRKKYANRINTLNQNLEIIARNIDKQNRRLLDMKASKPLQDIVKRVEAQAIERAKMTAEYARAEERNRALKREEALVEKYRQMALSKQERSYATQLRNDIRERMNDISSLLLKGNKKKNVKADLEGAIAEAMAELNYSLDSGRSENLTARLTVLQGAYEQLATENNKDLDLKNAYREEISEAIKNLKNVIGDKSIMEMSVSELELFDNTVRAMQHTIRTANKLFKEMQNKNIADLSFSTMRELQAQKSAVGVSIPKVEQFLFNNLKPQAAFDFIGSKTLCDLLQGMYNGEDVWAVDTAADKAFYEEQAKKYGITKPQLEKRITYELENGALSMTLDEAMAMYAYGKRMQALGHFLYRGGILLESDNNSKNGVIVKTYNEKLAQRLTQIDMSQIEKSLSEQQKAFVDAMQAYSSTTHSDRGNEVSLALYGIRQFREKNYIPIHTAEEFTQVQNQKNQGEKRLVNSGFAQALTPNASSPIIVKGFTQLWAEHANDMNNYHAFVLPLENFYRVYNFRTYSADADVTSVQQELKRTRNGKSAQTYIKQLLRDLNGGAQSDSAANITNQLISLFKKGAVFASASVTIQQYSAIVRAMAMVDPKYFATSTFSKDNISNFAHHANKWAEVKKYAPVAMIKEMGFFDTNVGRQAAEYMTSESYDKLADKLKGFVKDGSYRDEILSRAPALMDEFGWLSIWDAVKREQGAKLGKPLNDEAVLKAAGTRFSEVVRRTQVYDSTLSRSANMRSKDTGMKMVTSFMAEPTTTYSMLASAVNGGVKTTAQSLGAITASIILNALLYGIVGAARKKDEDKTFGEKYVDVVKDKFIDEINPLNLIPIVRDIVSIFQGYDVERADMSLINDLYDAIDGLKSSNKTTYEKVRNLAGTIAAFFGLPVKNILRDAEAIYNTFFGSTTVFEAMPKEESDPDAAKTTAFKDAFNRGNNTKGASEVDAYVEKKTQEYLDSNAYATEDDAKAAAISSAKSAMTNAYKEIYIRAWSDSAYKADMAKVKAILESSGLYVDDKGKSTVDETLNGWLKQYLKDEYKVAYIKAYIAGNNTEMQRIRLYLQSTKVWSKTSELADMFATWNKEALKKKQGK